LVSALEQRREQVNEGKTTLTNGNAFEQVSEQLGALTTQMDETAEAQQRHATTLNQDLAGKLCLSSFQIYAMRSYSNYLFMFRSARMRTRS
jgi:hypothetical protein